MNNRSVEKVCSISSIRKVLARQHISPEGLMTRHENIQSDQQPVPALKANLEGPDPSESRYLNDDDGKK